MDFKKRSLITLLVVSLFLFSSCEVYRTLYGNAKGPTGEVIAPPQNNNTEAANETYPEAAENQPNETPRETTETGVTPVVEKGTQKTGGESQQTQKEKPIVIVVQETDLVDLQPKASDPDKDTKLTFTFTSPLSDTGKWQTNYGDADQYTITVTASDGELTTSRDVLLIVNKKEEAPTIDSAKPIESALAIDETQSIDFETQASDLNKDPLAYTWKLDGNAVSSENKYSYQTDYDSAGTHTVKIDVSDGVLSASKLWSVNVKNVNRAPVVEKINDVHAKETDKIVVTVSAYDPDKDTINYSISDSRFKQDANVFTWQTDYDSSGIYNVTVRVADGQAVTTRPFMVEVGNVDRPPVINDIVLVK